MKHSTFMAAAHEFANDFISSGFKSANPAVGQERFFIEVAFEQYMERHSKFTLMKLEDPNWTVFHTNAHNDHLKQVRERYLAREGIEKYMNAGNSDQPVEISQYLYYGQLPPSLLKRMRTGLGASPLGSYWRAFKHKLKLKTE